MNKLQRKLTNDSTLSMGTEPLFSRQGSSTSVSTNTTMPSPRVLPQSLSFTKINDSSPVPPLQSNGSTLSLDSLHLALSGIKGANSPKVLLNQPKSTNRLTTTPTNEPSLDSKWCIVLVGLPATGKSSICKNLIKFSTRRFHEDYHIQNFKIDSFNAGHFRRKLSNFKDQTSDYFSVNNSEAKLQRERFAQIALDHLLNSLLGEQINVGIFDATNSTRARRNYIFNAIAEKEAKTGIKINTVILHVKCTDDKLWRYNVEGKTVGPDYTQMAHDDAINDFIHRAECYKQAFEDITQEELQSHEGCIYVEVDNAGKQCNVINTGLKDVEHDLIFAEMESFFTSYYNDYGREYETNAREFWCHPHPETVK